MLQLNQQLKKIKQSEKHSYLFRFKQDSQLYSVQQSNKREVYSTTETFHTFSLKKLKLLIKLIQVTDQIAHISSNFKPNPQIPKFPKCNFFNKHPKCNAP